MPRLAKGPDEFDGRGELVEDALPDFVSREGVVPVVAAVDLFAVALSSGNESLGRLGVEGLSNSSEASGKVVDDVSSDLDVF